MTTATIPTSRIIVWTLRIAALALVAWALHHTVRGGLDRLSLRHWHAEPGWLIASGVIYALALVPMGWFWRRTLFALGSPAPLLPTMAGYFLGHLGKYVPGKAMSVILRVATIRKWVPSMRIAFISTLLETLTMMAVGACLAALMAAIFLHLDALKTFAAVAMAIIAVAPTLPPVARRLASFGLRRETVGDCPDFAQSAKQNGTVPLSASTVVQSQSDTSTTIASSEILARLEAIDFRLLAQGWLAAMVCWLLQAISLWAILHAIGVEHVDPLHDLPRLIATVAFAVVGGFLSQLPAGLVVRDSLLVTLLVPVCGEDNAVVAAVLMRIVSLMSELIVCGILYTVNAVTSKTSTS